MKSAERALLCLRDRLALTVPEAADRLGLSERHLRAMLPTIPTCTWVAGR